MTRAAAAKGARRVAREREVLAVAAQLFARLGPSGASLRDVATAAGCSHVLVVRYFGSKEGLVAAVASQLGARVAEAVARVGSEAAAGSDGLLALLAAAPAGSTCRSLLVRAGLGDLGPSAREVEPVAGHLLGLAAEASGRPGRPTERARRCAYGAASLLLGWLTFEGFVVAATRLGAVTAHSRERAVAGAAHHLLALAGAAAPRLTRRHVPARVASGPAPPVPAGSRDALLAAAIALLAAHGPAAVSVRDVARAAGVNQGLIYRHFGSKDVLLAEAIEQGSAGLFPAALGPGGFDLDAVAHGLHHGSPAPRLIARTLVDGVDISTVRPQYPVVGALLAAYPDLPTGAGPGGLRDPRVAVAAVAAMALGSVVWGPQLAQALALASPHGLDATVADLARVLLAAPTLPRRPAES